MTNMSKKNLFLFHIIRSQYLHSTAGIANMVPMGAWSPAGHVISKLLK